MGARRRFDHEAAQRRYAAGDAISAIARDVGVSPRAVRFIVDEGAREALMARIKARQQSTCVECGGPCVTNKYSPRAKGRCRKCFEKAQATSVRDDALRCVTCHEWKADRDFPHNRRERARRGRHGACRACQTANRRAYRERNKVPCSHGCGRLVLHENGGKKPACARCARRSVYGKGVPA